MKIRYICLICNSSFYTLTGLYYHLRCNHYSWLDNIDITDFQYTRKHDDLLAAFIPKAHIQKNSLNTYCPVCKEELSTNEYSTHFMNEHREKLEIIYKIIFPDKHVREQEYSRLELERNIREKNKKLKKEKESELIKINTTFVDIKPCAQMFLKKQLYEKVYFTEVFSLYQGFDKHNLHVEEINEILHKHGKEITSLNDYYILVEIGTHEARKKSFDSIKFGKKSEIKIPGYRNDLAMDNGTHIPREESGRLASGTVEDNYE